MPTDATKKGDTPAEVYLYNEFRAINAHVPRRRKSIEELLGESAPQIDCGDGSTHFFRKKELHLLADMLDDEERKDFMLPMLIEVSSRDNSYAVPSPRGTEAKVLSKICGTNLSPVMNRVTLFKPHLSVIRSSLKTCTQYIFVA
ncbi:MAG TPA: DUF61 family protein [Deltaproteobacteria bacterium]|nr:DUF61 family protein [Deltaproteobacteria bacterium]